MKLSRRMEALAALVSQGSRLADIGCDHAYLPIALCSGGKIPSALAMDLREGPLEHARENILAYQLADRIEIRLSDGMRELKEGEADAVMISGMGGLLICRILQEGSGVLPSVKELILGPQSDEDAVRRLLGELGFVLDREDMVEEDGKYYALLHAVHGQPQKLTRAQEIYGPHLLRNHHPVLKEFLLKQQKQAADLEHKLAGSDSEKCRQRREELKRELQILKEAIDTCQEA